MLNTVGEISPFRRINRNYHSTIHQLITHYPSNTLGHGPTCGPHEIVRMQVVDGQKVPWAAIGAEREYARWATSWPPHTGIRLNPLKNFLDRPRQYDLITNTNTTPPQTPPQGAMRTLACMGARRASDSSSPLSPLAALPNPKVEPTYIFMRVRACMKACIYACMYARMHVCIHVYTYVCM